MRFVQQRHRPPAELDRPRELVVACAPMRSNVNLSRIVRTAGCCGVRQLLCCGNAKIIAKIARDSRADDDEDAAELGVTVHVHRTLAHPLIELKAEGYRLVGLEQTTNSQNLHSYAFDRRSVLVIGNERHGIDDEILAVLDDVVEIPVWGSPDAYNAATAAALAMYEYCRQFPRG